MKLDFIPILTVATKEEVVSNLAALALSFGGKDERDGCELLAMALSIALTTTNASGALVETLDTNQKDCCCAECVMARMLPQDPRKVVKIITTYLIKHSYSVTKAQFLLSLAVHMLEKNLQHEGPVQ